MIRALVAVALLATVAVPATAAAKVAVCVLYFDNHSGEARYDALRKGLADMLTTDLAAVTDLALVERSRLQDIVDEQNLQASSLFDQATTVRVGKLVGARFAITGAITALAPTMRLDVRVIDVESGRVVLSDKVTGAQDAFFELYRGLVDRFATSLGAKMVQASRVDDLQTVLAYSDGVVAADRGDLQLASAHLAEAVKRAPTFQLAQTRYQEVLRRLYAAKERRVDALGDAVEALLKAADERLKADPKRLRGAKQKERFAYRVMRGRLFIAALYGLVGKPSSPFSATPIPTDERDAAKRLIADYLANQRAFVAEMAAVRGGKRGPISAVSMTFLPDPDKKRAQELGLGTNPGSMAFASPQVVLRELAHVLCLGGPSLMEPINFRVSPAPWELDPAWAKAATDALDEALADITAFTRDDFVERETIRALELYGDCLLAMDRKAEAIARWQTILDTYPTASEFGDIEEKIKEALGVR